MRCFFNRPAPTGSWSKDVSWTGNLITLAKTTEDKRKKRQTISHINKAFNTKQFFNITNTTNRNITTSHISYVWVNNILWSCISTYFNTCDDMNMNEYTNNLAHIVFVPLHLLSHLSPAISFLLEQRHSTLLHFWRTLIRLAYSRRMKM